ncbi:Aristolochene synthase [Beauveria bassiana]|uniref:Aristolochene synthase n=1 Tax=Beauveria bassiana TaxID=176275 RepID=A0A2N6NEW9_BEABA|nr:Aristolochene synthase [Beauveria bassiana]
MDLHLTADELLATRLVEENCSKHMSIVNDICSWERELRQSRSTTQEGARLCNGVQILSASLGLDVEATKACLWTMVREWEVNHERLSDISKEAMLYLKGLEYQMSGNELRSRTTPRYLVLD